MHSDAQATWIVVGCVTLVSIIVWVAERFAREKRRRECTAFAQAHGLRYSYRDPYGTARRDPHALLNRGHSRRAENIIHGEYRGRRVRCFDYRYTVQSHKTSRTYCMTCLLLEAPIRFEIDTPAINDPAKVSFESRSGRARKQRQALG